MAAPVARPVLLRAARPLRRAAAVVLAVVGTADVAAAVAAPGNGVGIPVLAQPVRLPLLVYGVLLVLAGGWAGVTSFEQVAPGGRGPAATAPAAGGPGRRRASALHGLRPKGWYVADDVALRGITADHVAVGPAGVLVVQAAAGADPDSWRSPSVRARIAAQQLRRMLAGREVEADIVPAVLVPGPGRGRGIDVVDSVAILSAGRADEWIAELVGRRLLPPATVDAVVTLVADARDGRPTGRRRAVTARPAAC